MKKYLVTMFAVAALLLTVLPVLASSPKDSLPPKVDKPDKEAPRGGTSLTRVGGWPYGLAEAIAADTSRELVFLGSGGAVLIFDVSNPLSPVLLTDQLKTPGFVEDLFYETATQRLYVAAEQGGLEIWDVQTAANPQQLSTTEIIYGGVDIPVLGIAVVDNMAYIAGDWGYLHWVDVSDPTNPVQEGFNGQAVRPTKVFATDSHVYAVGNDTGAFFEGDFARFGIDPDGSLDFQGGRDFGICGSVAIEGSQAYVGCGDWYILDLTDPNFDTLGTLPIDAGGTIISGTQAYVASYSSGLHSIDVTAPGAPNQDDMLDSAGSANELVRIGDFGFMADGHAGLRVIDISDPANLNEVSFHDTPGYSYNVAVQGDHAYLANSSDGLQIIDVSAPLSATLSSNFNTISATYDVAVQGDYAYAADIDQGLRVIDISDPANPQEVGAYENLSAFRVDVDGDYAYVADAVVNQPYWLRIIDVSDPAHPTEVGAIELGTLIWRIAAQNGYVYVANHDTGLRVIDATNPNQPVEVGSYLVPDVWDVSLQGNYAYVASADWDGGFLVFDISNPANPTLIAEYNPSGWFHPYHVEVLGRFAYVSRQDELNLFDISDPANPQLLETVDLPLSASSLAAAGAYVYVADPKAGVPIFQNLLSNAAVDLTIFPEGQEALPGTAISYTFTLTNMGIYSDSFDLSLDSSWPMTMPATSTGSIPSGGTFSGLFWIELPITVPGEQATAVLTAVSTLDPTVSTEAEVTTTVGEMPYQIYLPLTLQP